MKHVEMGDCLHESLPMLWNFRRRCGIFKRGSQKQSSPARIQQKVLQGSLQRPQLPYEIPMDTNIFHLHVLPVHHLRHQILNQSNAINFYTKFRHCTFKTFQRKILEWRSGDAASGAAS